jgi:hypothetical protein
MDEREQGTGGNGATQMTEEKTATGGGWPEDNSHLPPRPSWGTVNPKKFWGEYRRLQEEKNLIDLDEYWSPFMPLAATVILPALT